MTLHQIAMLEAAGWIVVESGFWKSPITDRAFTDAESLGMLALTAIRARRGTTVHRPRRWRCTP